MNEKGFFIWFFGGKTRLPRAGFSRPKRSRPRICSPCFFPRRLCAAARSCPRPRVARLWLVLVRVPRVCVQKFFCAHIIRGAARRSNYLACSRRLDKSCKNFITIFYYCCLWFFSSSLKFFILQILFERNALPTITKSFDHLNETLCRPYRKALII